MKIGYLIQYVFKNLDNLELEIIRDAVFSESRAYLPRYICRYQSVTDRSNVEM